MMNFLKIAVATLWERESAQEISSYCSIVPLKESKSLSCDRWVAGMGMLKCDTLGHLFVVFVMFIISRLQCL